MLPFLLNQHNGGQHDHTTEYLKTMETFTQKNKTIRPAVTASKVTIMVARVDPRRSMTQTNRAKGTTVPRLEQRKIKVHEMAFQPMVKSRTGPKTTFQVMAPTMRA